MRLKLLATLMAIGFAARTAQAVVTQQMIDNDASETREVLSRGMGAGFTIKTPGDSPIGALRPINRKTGKIVWEVPNNAPLWGCADDGWQPGILGHARRLSASCGRHFCSTFFD